MDCTACRFWLAPPEMAPEHAAEMIRRGVDRKGTCRRFPRHEKTEGAHWCGEFRSPKAGAPEKPQEPA